MNYRAATMEKNIFFMFLCTAVEGNIGKHIFVPNPMTWLGAQTYCRQYYTDLSFIESPRDLNKLETAAGARVIEGWIGLYRDLRNDNAWKWSGGGNITYQDWSKGQPDNFANSENNAYIRSNGKWNDIDGTLLKPFYCIHITAVAVAATKTWEEALKHCQENQTDLTSLLSETEHLLVQKLFQKVHITERVWIGLRYLDDCWLWVNGDPLVYQAWARGANQDQQCPIYERCGALTKDGVWENRDCQERLSFICS